MCQIIKKKSKHGFCEDYHTEKTVMSTNDDKSELQQHVCYNYNSMKITVLSLKIR